MSTQMHAEKSQKRKESAEGGREGGGEGENSEAEKQKDGGGQGLKGEGKLPSFVQVPCPHLPTPTRAKQPARGLEDQSGGAEGAGRGGGGRPPRNLQPSLWLARALFPLHMGVLQSLRCSWETGDALCRWGWVEGLTPAASTGIGAGETKWGLGPGSARKPGVSSARPPF